MIPKLNLENEVTKRKKIILSVVLIICIPIILIIIWNRLEHYYLSPFEGKVIDVDTKGPIEGAVVLAVYHNTVHTIAGSNTYAVDAQETLTDANGEFKIPLKTGHSEKLSGKPIGKLIIFKPRYGVFPRHKQSEAIGENKSWPPPNKYIVYEIPKLKSMKERDNNIHFSRPDIHSSKMKNFIRLLNEERISFGYAPFTITEEER